MLYLDYWKDIKRHEDKYAAAYCGNVRSWGRYVKNNGGKKFVKGKVLRTSLRGGWYLQVRLYDNGIARTKKVHRLIAETFIPNPNNYPQVNHVIGVKRINCVPNLEWCNNSMNMKHAFKNGLTKNTFAKGEKHPRAKLAEKQVVKIKKQLSQGFKGVDLAIEHGVDPKTISMIKTGKRWAHV